MSKPRVVHAEPTKDFFIYMLVKDIPLNRAVLDLVDNCVDGATGLRGRRPFTGLHVRMEVTPQRFRIRDNCGGIPVEVAEKYAFRFGRPPGAKALDGSVGQFGVGMKRAFFKLGKRFVVESRAERDEFTVAEDVDKWCESPEWEFGFRKLKENLPKRPQKERGTTIEVTQLHEGVSEQFGLQNFRTRLREEIEVAHETSLGRGLEIALNGHVLQDRPRSLKQSADITPAFRERRFGDVMVKLYVGISRFDPRNAGWNVYCNGRLVLEADQSRGTGWGEGPGLPRFHPQYNMFKGYAFFEADDSSSLPWNTTKTGVDADSSIFRSARQEMLIMMAPVIRFLNRLDRARTAGEDWLLSAVEDAKEADLKRISDSETFGWPDKPKPPPPDTQRISYDRPREQVNKVKKTLGLRSSREVGETTFDYFYGRECKD